MTLEIWELPAREIVKQVRSGEVWAREIAESYFARIRETDPAIRAYLAVLESEARVQAAKIDDAVRKGEDPGILAGLPCAVKDNISLQGVPCTCASKILEGYVSPYDATAVRRMRREGAIFTGKTNLDEFAMGSSTQNSAFFSTRNPWDPERVPGGSSGGSAAAVAAGMAAVALGSDTGGSIRQPAAYTGIYGLQPTYGRVSRYGLVAFGSSLDQIGPFGQSVWDCALLLEVISGHDPSDVTTSDRPVPPFTKRLERSVKGLRAGVPKELSGLKVSLGVKEAFVRALSVLADLGVIIEETSLPAVRYALDTYYIIAASEASSNLARFDGVRYGLSHRGRSLAEMYAETRGQGFGKEVRRRIMLGSFALSADHYDDSYLRAAKIRTLVRRDFDEAFQTYDVLLSPTTPDVAYRLGEKTRDPMAMYMDDVLTVPVNLAGIPALSVPCGFVAPSRTRTGPEAGNSSEAGCQELPCGLQIMGRSFDEETVLALGYALESEMGDHTMKRTAAMRQRLAGLKEREHVG